MLCNEFQHGENGLRSLGCAVSGSTQEDDAGSESVAQGEKCAEASRGSRQRQHRLIDRGRSEQESLTDVVLCQLGEISDDLGRGHALSYHPDDRRDRDASTPDTGDSAMIFWSAMIRSNAMTEEYRRQRPTRTISGTPDDLIAR